MNTRKFDADANGDAQGAVYRGVRDAARHPQPARTDILPDERDRAHLYVCTNCRHDTWKQYPRTAKQTEMFRCEHCGHELQERFPQRVDLNAEDQGLLRWLSAEIGVPASDVLAAALVPLAREIASQKAQRGKKLPQWLADRLQKKPGV